MQGRGLKIDIETEHLIYGVAVALGLTRRSQLTKKSGHNTWYMTACGGLKKVVSIVISRMLRCQSRWTCLSFELIPSPNVKTPHPLMSNALHILQYITMGICVIRGRGGWI